MTISLDRLRELRKKRGLTQRQMADILKITERSYQRYEGGERVPELDILCAIADFFGVSVDYLLGRMGKV